MAQITYYDTVCGGVDETYCSDRSMPTIVDMHFDE